MPRLNLNPRLNSEVAAILNTYEDLRVVMPRFPTAGKRQKPKAVPSLRHIVGEFDALFLDGFGVLNIGDTLISGAKELIALAQARGVAVFVVTNAASQSVAKIGRRYLDKGLDIQPSQVIASRQALTHWLIHQRPPAIRTIAIADQHATLLDLAEVEAITQQHLTPSSDSQSNYNYDAIAILGTKGWDAGWDEVLRAALTNSDSTLKISPEISPKILPETSPETSPEISSEISPEILIANPDVAAPYAGGFSREPGAIAHTLRQTHPDTRIRWFGKPHKPHFDLALASLDAWLADNGKTAIGDKKRIAMVGDSLHTDILGGAAAGLTTVLVTDHGLFRDGGAEEAIAMTGIVPDYITPTI